jgi:cytochrome bd-type quinol oxidase subunit 2
MSKGWNRLFRTAPEREGEEGAESVGVAFVSILFGVVVGLIVGELAQEVQAGFDPAKQVREPRLLHLAVGTVLATLSFIGYYSSKNRPTHRIKFFNLPLAAFVLDVLMVFAYYLVFSFTESQAGADVATRSDARSEAYIIALAFLLYSLWDLVSWRIKSDQPYQDAVKPKDAVQGQIHTDFGARRWTTLAFLVIFGVFAVIIALVDSSSDGTVVAFDVALIALLVAYRVAKSSFDPGVKIRT